MGEIMSDTTPSEQAEQQFLAAVQKAIVDAVGAWAKNVEALSAAYPPVPEDEQRLPSAERVVEQSFDFAEKLLASQREFARNLLAAAAPAFSQQQRVTDEG
jgi:hypothetical protein